MPHLEMPHFQMGTRVTVSSGLRQTTVEQAKSENRLFMGQNVIAWIFLVKKFLPDSFHLFLNKE